YVFIERKRGDEEIFRVDSLSDSAYSQRNLKIDFRIGVWKSIIIAFSFKQCYYFNDVNIIKFIR
ncbi:MAG: hypothetical protein K2P50_00060, partial [Lachnospiraceae bacterium]|nr:hypothetical protein [Lachnospiraceae bacterium]